MTEKPIRNELRSIRRTMNFSQADMALRMGDKAQSTYSGWEANPEKQSRELLMKAEAIYFEVTGKHWPFLPDRPAIAEKEPFTVMGQDDAVQRAYFILKEVRAVSPRLRELWTDQDEAEFLAGVTKLLTSAQQTELVESLRTLLVHVAKGAEKAERPLPKVL